MRADIILGIATVGMAILGGIVSVHPPDTHRQKTWLVIAFLALGVVCVIFVIKQSNENAAANTNLANSLGNLRTSTAEISRITNLNTDLQHQLLESTATIASLSRKNIDTVTGGDSFCYLVLNATGACSPPFITESIRCAA